MKKIFHLGFHKTGSTHLQTEIFPQLADVLLLTRPHTELFAAFNQLKYDTDDAYDPSRVDKLIQEAATQNPSAKTLLISDETMLGAPYKNYLNRDAIARRLKALSPDAEVIIFLRGQIDLIGSLYNQYVKVRALQCEFGSEFIALNGVGVRFTDRGNYQADRDMRPHHFVHPLIGWMDVSRFKYNSLIDSYYANFAKVHVFLYEDLLKRPTVVYERLSAILGESISYTPSSAQKAKANPRLSDDRMWRTLIQERVQRSFPEMNRLLKRALSYGYYRCAKSGLSERKQQHLDKLKNEAGFSEDNRIVNDKYSLGMERYPDQYFYEINAD